MSGSLPIPWFAVLRSGNMGVSKTRSGLGQIGISHMVIFFPSVGLSVVNQYQKLLAASYVSTTAEVRV